MVLGCSDQSSSSINSLGIKSITLECIQLCLEQKEVSFIEKKITDSESIELFHRAINGAERSDGILDYDVLFKMKMTMNDGKEIEYYLNIENTERPQIGLVIKLPNTEQCYVLPEKTSDKLRKIIYNS